jgi:hypothetical protein
MSVVGNGTSEAEPCADGRGRTCATALYAAGPVGPIP